MEILKWYAESKSILQLNSLKWNLWLRRKQVLNYQKILKWYAESRSILQLNSLKWNLCLRRKQVLNYEVSICFFALGCFVLSRGKDYNFTFCKLSKVLPNYSVLCIIFLILIPWFVIWLCFILKKKSVEQVLGDMIEVKDAYFFTCFISRKHISI